MKPMQQQDIFTLALGLKDPWSVSRVEMIPSEAEAMRSELHISVERREDSTLPCPLCARECTAHDASQRTWRHLNFFQHRCYIHAPLVQITCPDHAVQTVEVPWAREGNGFTLW